METMLGAQKIIIDTDPGQDDAVAILLALASPDEIEVLGITAVAGNVPLSLTEKNARIVCELAGRSDIGVYAGCARPLKRKLIRKKLNNITNGEIEIDYKMRFPKKVKK